LGELEDRRCHFCKAVQLGEIPCHFGHLAMSSGNLREEVLSTTNRLQGLHTLFSAPPVEGALWLIILDKLLHAVENRNGIAGTGTADQCQMARLTLRGKSAYSIPQITSLPRCLAPVHGRRSSE